ncbi:hypothetical protein QIS99_25475 [Streptomyces sp. B-S-A8]|uniref:Uncharacterized protein n=1 Tax=Streptomyces solicavernae TaxID=3043614 RepID=A0ABT6RYM6_9ACTN|nr:hypothetical protein [Streptomyces sp. B-S-A8]MDI3389518.1 hypothetical protein [Streptomyces sp. B-S-A8]
MLTAVVRETSSLFDRRFLLNALLPVLITLSLLTGVVISTLTDPARMWREWNNLDATLRVLAGTGAVVVSVVLAAVVSGRSQSLIRCYEGLWPGRLGDAVMLPGRRWHRRRARRLGFDRAVSDYPADMRDIMPTRLGNILRAAESYPHERYGLDAVVTWPRLFPLLPEGLAAALVAARAEIEFHVTISALASLVAVGAGGWLAAVNGPAWLFLTCYWAGAATAWLTYRGALAPARLYGEHVRVAFDLYRQELLTHLGIEGDERDQWARLNHFWYRNIPMETPLLPHPDGPEDDVPEEPSWPAFPPQLPTWSLIILSGLLVVWLR